jgi:hypothetical protein
MGATKHRWGGLALSLIFEPIVLAVAVASLAVDLVSTGLERLRPPPLD